MPHRLALFLIKYDHELVRPLEPVGNDWRSRFDGVMATLLDTFAHNCAECSFPTGSSLCRVCERASCGQWGGYSSDGYESDDDRQHW